VNLSHLVRRSAIALSVLVPLLLPVHAFSTELFPNWTVSEFRPNLKQGGRTNTVAVNPANGNEMFAASDSGGLFKSIDGGVNWTHVDGLPIFTQAVAYVPGTPGVVLLTAKVDFRTVNGGGIWRSVDNGNTWEQATLERPNPPNPPLSAFEISAAGNEVVVGTSDGVFVSIDAGATWHWSFPFAGGVPSVLLTPGQNGELTRVYAAGPAGVRLGVLFGVQLSSWVNPGNFIGGNTITIHSLGRSALSPNHAYITNGHQLFRTEDRGAHWTEVPLLLHGNPTCKGTAFIKTAYRTRGAAQFLDLYHGNGCGVDRMSAPVFGALPDYSAQWEPVSIDHFTRDLALYRNAPALMASNGGVHSTTDGGATWAFTGGGSGGYNALQVTSVTGQYVGKNLLDLYFATQDNNVWWTNSAGNPTVAEPVVREGFHMEAETRVKFGAGSRITYVGCDVDCKPRMAAQFLANPANIGHSHSPEAAPVLIGNGRRVQDTENGLDVTSDLATWQPFALFTPQQTTLPKLGFVGTSNAPTVVYQSYAQGAVMTLKRIENSGGIGAVIPPLMSGFGSLAVNRSMPLALHPVYDVAHDTGERLIAADDKDMMQSTNSGDLWTAIPNLKTLLLDEGKLQFNARLHGIPLVMPLVTAISFCPTDPSQILVGTSEGGIYYSYNRGRTWGRIGGSRNATYVTSFFWANLNTVYVSTFGRGLWRLNNHPIFPETLGDICPTCGLVTDDPRPAFDRSAVIFDGSMLGVRTEKGQLREIFVTPGSSVIFTGDPKNPQQNIIITESDGKGSYEPLPKPPVDGWIATGVAFTNDAMVGTVFNASELSLTLPSPEKGK